MKRKLRSLKVSFELLSHFRCSTCHHWWSVADAPRQKKQWFCPWCGRSQASLGQPRQASLTTTGRQQKISQMSSRRR